jgi:hypothetical protein
MINARALQIVIPSGEPNGLRIIKLSGWDGNCYIVPRQRFNELLNVPEINKPGLYFLFGSDESTDEPLAYIGESENFMNRISSHNSTKDFWDEAIIFTGELNKAHVKYLEHKAVQLAKSAGRVNLQNSTAPIENRLSEYDKVATDQFFTNTMFILESFGYDLFKSIDESTKSNGTYYLKGRGFDATARLLNNGGMVVLSGSLASKIESASFGGWAKAARKKFLDSEELVEEGDIYRLTTDITFSSPSGAAATIAARSINGWTAWKDAEGFTLDTNIRKNN